MTSARPRGDGRPPARPTGARTCPGRAVATCYIPDIEWKSASRILLSGREEYAVKRKLVVGTLFVVAVGASVAWVARAVASRNPGATSGTEVARVTRGDVTSVVKATGVIRAVVGAEVRVGSTASGVVRKLRVRVGDRVEKGQLLAELDTDELAARRDQAAAALASARATARYAAAELERKRALAAREAVSRSDLDLAERTFAVARASEDEARANLELTSAQLAHARIRAPIGGVVASVATQQGETVAASFAAPTFVTIVDLDRLEVWAYVDETDIGRIRPGQEARFSVDTYPDREFDGRVADIHPKAEIRDNVVNYVGVVSFSSPPDATLRPEMTASVRVVTEKRAGVLTVPRRAVRREQGRSFVLVPDGDRLERRWVTTGGRDESRWEIIDGLREGDSVLIRGGEGVGAGDVIESSSRRKSS
jgi:macrolide-specific efflux system membrane fusion protein